MLCEKNRKYDADCVSGCFGDMWKISLVFLDYKAQRQTDSQSRCAFFDFCFGGSDFFIKGFIDS